MTQADIIQAVQDELGPDTKISKTTIEEVLKAAGTVNLRILSDGGEVSLFALGKIKVAKRAARQGRNPRTGAAVNIPARKVAKYTANKAVKDALK